MFDCLKLTVYYVNSKVIYKLGSLYETMKNKNLSNHFFLVFTSCTLQDLGSTMPTYPSKRRKVTLNTMSRTTKILILLLCFSLFSNFNNVSCQPDAGKDSDIDIPALLFFYIIDQEEKNSFEPNNTKETAYCLDNTSIGSIISPREDIDYYKIFFRNQRISLSHFTSQSEFFHILLESDSGALYDSRNPEAINVFIESNQLVQIPLSRGTAEARTIITKDLNFVYLKLLHNEKFSYPIGGIPYRILLKNDPPSITDTSSFDFFRLTGEFEPCPR